MNGPLNCSLELFTTIFERIEITEFNFMFHIPY